MTDKPNTVVRVIKYDLGSPTDTALRSMQRKLSASTTVEAMRRSVEIASKLTDLTESGHKLFIQDTNGNIRELVIS